MSAERLAEIRTHYEAALQESQIMGPSTSAAFGAIPALLAEVDRLRGVIDRHDEGIMPVCEGYQSERANLAEAEADRLREKNETLAEKAAALRTESDLIADERDRLREETARLAAALKAADRDLEDARAEAETWRDRAEGAGSGT